MSPLSGVASLVDMDPFAHPKPPESRAGIGAAFRDARDAAGLSQRELATLLGTSAAAIHDIEANDDELFRSYSLAELGLIAGVLGREVAQLLNCETQEPPIHVAGLIQQIRRQSEESPATIKEFENSIGWRMTGLIESPETLMADLTVEGLQRLCAAVELDWRRVARGLASVEGRGGGD